MQITLAGYNIDLDALNQAIQDLEKSVPDVSGALSALKSLTPETISASYARISRDPRPIGKLREAARTDLSAARKSNQAIIFTMGHRSIAEHACFNFDLLGISRLAVEQIERSRLCSYTEKSQRYITLAAEYTVPAEIINAGFENAYRSLVEKDQYAFYFSVLPELEKWHTENTPDDFFQAMGILQNDAKKKQVIEGLAKEDARYALPLSAHAQLGLTINGRNLEQLVTRLRSSGLTEEKDAGEKLYNLAYGLAPSIIKYLDESDYYKNTYSEIKDFFAGLLRKNKPGKTKPACVFSGLKPDISIPAAFLFSSGSLDYKTCLSLAGNFTPAFQKKLLGLSLQYKDHFDPLPREFEIQNTVCELTVSASCFAQIKRHRMNTIICQAYSPHLHFTIPPSVAGIGKKNEFEKLMLKTGDFYFRLEKAGVPACALPYVLTNAHRRRVLLAANIRQVYAIAMERLNLFAQWDIRGTIKEYLGAMKKTAPYMLQAACGKHEYHSIKSLFMGKL
ncbi:MAG: hypothetical protein A2096_05690 [Spirochaetes bacterium GWF1_41_5]|nr:MAG: hypothetical protein A2096_05690 [Spirochaetes bacterium GWF1_41_5]HBE01579.1 hypothetical protein [Spirochaetia bacterium]